MTESGGGFFWLLLIASIVAMLGRYIRLPYTIALVVTGLLMGGLGVIPNVRLEPHILFTVFLPPLLFEAGIHIRLEPLKKQWIVIGTLALFGTLISTIVVGGILHYLLELPLVLALLFGAIISPTDPISVLAMFKRLGINHELSLIVEAESLLNDGIAIVVFGVLQGLLVTSVFSLETVFIKFVTTVMGGALVGITIGYGASRLTQAFDDHLLEITLTTIVAYGSYLAAEATHVSGVIAVVVASLTVGNYGMVKGMSATSRLAVYSFWEYAAFVANSMVFLLVGFEEATIQGLSRSAGIIVLVFFIVVVGRACSIYGLLLMIRTFLRKIVPMSWQHALVWSGLRGALSMAMVLGLGVEVPHRETLLILTFGCVLISLVGQGLTIEPLVKRLGLVETKQHSKLYHELLAESIMISASKKELDRCLEIGIISTSMHAALSKELNKRKTVSEQKLIELYENDPIVHDEEHKHINRLLLTAEKSALINAERNHGLDSDVTSERLSEIDEQLEKQRINHSE